MIDFLVRKNEVFYPLTYSEVSNLPTVKLTCLSTTDQIHIVQACISYGLDVSFLGDHTEQAYYHSRNIIEPRSVVFDVITSFKKMDRTTNSKC